MTLKTDYEGNLVEIGNATTVNKWGIVHYIFAPKVTCQLITRCGRRGNGVLGNEKVNCEDCLI